MDIDYNRKLITYVGDGNRYLDDVQVMKMDEKKPYYKPTQVN